MLPKKTSAIPNVKSDCGGDKLPASAIVMYEHDNSPLLACIIDFKKNKYRLLNQRGREIELPAGRIYSFSMLLPSGLTTQKAKTDFLEQMFEEARLASRQFDMSEVWSLVYAENISYSCKELAQNYLGDLTPAQHIAFRLALLNDKIYFKRKSESFQARAAETVAQIKHTELEKQRKAGLIEKAYEVLYARINDPQAAIPEELHAFVAMLQNIAAEADNTDASKVREVRDFIHSFCEKYDLQISGNNNERVYNFLRKVNVFDNFTNLSLIRHKWPLEFSEDALKAAQEIDLQKALRDPARIDLTNLNTFTVDDISTKDMDDAISLEYTLEGFKLGIHISDVASVVSDNSIVQKCAEKRVSSIYLPDKVINMFPESLSQDKLSLVKGEERPVISYLFDIDRNFRIINCEIKLALIKVKNRYNYDQACAFLEDETHTDFQALHGITATHDMKRIEGGAMKLNKKEALVNIHDDGTLSLQEIDEDSPGRSLISELMVLTNSHTAAFAKKNNIPLIYRTQEKPDIVISSNDNTDNPAAHRMHLKKSLNTVSAKPHSGLGLDLYCQSTSPIRRYLDLCNQKQIAAFLLTSKASYSDEDLKRILKTSEEQVQKAYLLARESKRFWLLKYLEMYKFRKTPVYGVITRTDLRIPAVELEEVYLTVPVKIDKKYSVGDRLKLEIKSITPAFDHIKLEVVS